MRKTLEQIQEIVKTLNVGDMITVYAPNGTMHYGAARFYRRKGIFNGVVDNKLTILIGKNKRKFSFRLEKDYDMVDGVRVYKDTCWDILDIEKGIVWIT